MLQTRAFLRKFLKLYDEVRLSPKNPEAGETIILSSKIAGLVSDFGLYVENYNSGREALDALARLKESLKLANAGKMKMAASKMKEGAWLVAKLVVAEQRKSADNKDGEEQNG